MKFHNAILAGLCCFVAFGAGSQSPDSGEWQTGGSRKKRKGNKKRLTDAEGRYPKPKYGPRSKTWDVDGKGKYTEYTIIPVDELYYTHGDTGRTGTGCPTVSLHFSPPGVNRYGNRVTIYDSILALLVGDDKVEKGIIQRLVERDITASKVTPDALSNALWETQKAFLEAENWDGVPDVVLHKGRMYSNSNRRLYVLQAISKLFSCQPFKVRCISVNRKSECHEYSNIRDCAKMKVNFSYHNCLTQYNDTFPNRGFFDPVECTRQAWSEAIDLGRREVYEYFFDNRRRRMMAA